MNDLDQKALENLRSLAGEQSQAREIGKSIARSTGIIAGQKFRATRLNNPLAGSILVPADSRRVAFHVIPNSATVIISLEPEVPNASVQIPIVFGVTVQTFKLEEWGILVQQQWYCDSATATFFVYEVLI